MTRLSAVIPLLLLAACSTGLTVLGDTGVAQVDADTDTDTDVDSDTDVDTDTDADTDADTDIGTNNAPTADAGIDQEAVTGNVIQLDGLGSDDPDGDVLNYFWTMNVSPPGWAGTMINDDRFDASFFADTEGTYEVELNVDDGEFSASDTVVITVETPNEEPVANAGVDQYVDEGALVQLNGSNSSDPNGDPLTYYWTATSGSLTLNDPTLAMPSFTAASAGSYTLQLVVTDLDLVDSSPDSVTITATTTGGDTGGGGGGGCFGCIALTGHRVTSGSAAAMPGFLLLPLFFVLARRRE